MIFFEVSGCSYQYLSVVFGKSRKVLDTAARIWRNKTNRRTYNLTNPENPRVIRRDPGSDRPSSLPLTHRVSLMDENLVVQLGFRTRPLRDCPYLVGKRTTRSLTSCSSRSEESWDWLKRTQLPQGSLSFSLLSPVWPKKREAQIGNSLDSTEGSPTGGGGAHIDISRGMANKRRIERVPRWVWRVSPTGGEAQLWLRGGLFRCHQGNLWRREDHGPGRPPFYSTGSS